MIKVGVRELKRKLGFYLEKALQGEQVRITKRGKEIAVIVPLKKARNMDKLLKLLESGTASWKGGKPQGLERPPRISGESVSEIVIKERR